jgi:steroid delta-isomerase-like uncharacterized protein
MGWDSPQFAEARREALMDSGQMQSLVDAHLRAEGLGDVDGAVAVYTDDIEHDVVGFPNSPTRGVDGARDFYNYLTANFRSETEEVLHRYVTGNAIILEQIMTGSVIGEMFGLHGHGRRISFRMLHVFEFCDGAISRENIWLDSAAIVEQLN